MSARLVVRAAPVAVGTLAPVGAVLAGPAAATLAVPATPPPASGTVVSLPCS